MGCPHFSQKQMCVCVCVCVWAHTSILDDSPRLYTGADSDRSGGLLGPKNARAEFLPWLYNQKAVIIKKFRLITSHKDCILNLGDDFVVINNKPISPSCNLFLIFFAITNVLYKHSYSNPPKI